MISKSQISLVKSLHQKKYRKEHQLFIVEGFKAISEFFDSDFVINTIFCTTDFLPKLLGLYIKQKVCEFSINVLQKIIHNIHVLSINHIISEISINVYQKIRTLQTPQGILAIIKIPESQNIIPKDVDDLVIVLDGIQDPGNLGTIIRTADWFGFKQI